VRRAAFGIVDALDGNIDFDFDFDLSCEVVVGQRFCTSSSIR
jgi:hypothetical protein